MLELVFFCGITLITAGTSWSSPILGYPLTVLSVYVAYLLREQDKNYCRFMCESIQRIHADSLAKQAEILSKISIIDRKIKEMSTKYSNGDLLLSQKQMEWLIDVRTLYEHYESLYIQVREYMEIMATVLLLPVSSTEYKDTMTYADIQTRYQMETSRYTTKAPVEHHEIMSTVDFSSTQPSNSSFGNNREIFEDLFRREWEQRIESSRSNQNSDSGFSSTSSGVGGESEWDSGSDGSGDGGGGDGGGD